MEEPPIPDIKDFSLLFSLTDDELDVIIEHKYTQLKELYNDVSSYKLDLYMNLHNMLNRRKMEIWSYKKEHE